MHCCYVCHETLAFVTAVFPAYDSDYLPVTCYSKLCTIIFNGVQGGMTQPGLALNLPVVKKDPFAGVAVCVSSVVNTVGICVHVSVCTEISRWLSTPTAA